MNYRGAILGPVDGHQGGPRFRASAATPPGAEWPAGVPWAPGQVREVAYTTGARPDWLEPAPAEA